MIRETPDPEFDKQMGNIVLWLLLTGQEAHVSLDGEVAVRSEQRSAKHARAVALEKARLKRERKAAKRK